MAAAEFKPASRPLPCCLTLMGPPGAGKGTQGTRLSALFAVPHIASGDLLRRILAEEPNSDLARAAHVISEGKMVSDSVAGAIVFRELDKASGFILDGFPRNVAQGEQLLDYLAKSRRRLNAALYLEVSEAEILRRLSGRLTCVHCGATYHVVSEPPKIAGICDNCGNRLEVRPDDLPNRVRTRLQVYQERTAPLIDWYRGKGLLRTIEADGNEDIVFARCVAAIEACVESR